MTAIPFQLSVVQRGTSQWVDDAMAKNCRGCAASFTLMRRRHHCYSCGDIFCDTCAPKNATVFPPDAPDVGSLRVCRLCVAVHALVGAARGKAAKCDATDVVAIGTIVDAATQELREHIDASPRRQGTIAGSGMNYLQGLRKAAAAAAATAPAPAAAASP